MPSGASGWASRGLRMRSPWSACATAVAEAAERTGEWMAVIANAAYRASALIAAEKGAFPLYDAAEYAKAPMVKRLDPEVQALIAEHGLRNALLTSIAPTGTISLFAGNVSSGIEPIFATSYTRKVLQPDGTRTEEEVVDYAVQMWRDMKGDADLPDQIVTAQDLAPLEHVRMQAAAQPWVDSSISKTINVPADIGFEAFKDVYLEAYETGCKGCTTYRPNEVTGSVLSVETTRDASEDAPSRPLHLSTNTPGEAPQAAGAEPPATRATDSDVIYMSEPLDRPGSLEGHTYKLKWPDSDHALYITINDIMLHGHRRPFEIFINSKNMEHFAWTVALTRMISAVFRRGGDVSFVVEELKAVFDPRGGAWMNGKYVPSILAAIGGVIERHLISIGFIDGEGMGLKTDPQAEVVNLGRPAGPACPSCGQYDMRMIEGCLTCANCGHSKCG
jgi:ribonucleoside-diphosphate reductase alpha chain